MQHYQHSGAVPIGGVLLALIAGFVTAAVLGVAYTYLIVYIPFIYVNFLLTAGFGFVVGCVVAVAAKVGKIRNNLAAGALGLASGVVGLYFAWAADPVARIGGDVPFLAGFEPAMLFEYMQMLYENGAWTLFGNAPVTGIFLAAVWLIEAAVILGIAMFAAMASTASLPFCERCHQWTNVEENVQRLAVREGQDALLQRAAGGDLGALGELDRSQGADDSYLRLDLARCPSCTESHFLTIQQVRHYLDKQGEQKTDTTALLTNYSVHDRDLDRIRQAGREVKPAEPTDDQDLPDTDAASHDADLNRG